MPVWKGRWRVPGKDRLRLGGFRLVRGFFLLLRRLGELAVDEHVHAAAFGGGKGEFGAGKGAVSSGVAEPAESGGCEGPEIKMPVPPEDDHDRIVVDAADGDPFQSVYAGEEIRHHHEDVRVFHRAQIAVGPGTVLMHGRKGPSKILEPLGQVFAAENAREQGGIAVRGEVLVGAEVRFRARAGEGGGIRADAVLQGGRQPDAGPDMVGPQVFGQQRAHRAVLGPDVDVGRFDGVFRHNGMVIDDDGERDALERGIVVGLRIDHREPRVRGFQTVGQRDHGDTQVADHRQIVGPRNFVDAGDGDFPRAMGHDPLERHRGGHGIRIGVDDDQPVVIARKQFQQLRKARTELVIGRHDGFPPVEPR